MLLNSFAEILAHEGFEAIGELNYRIRISAWWNPSADKRVQVLVLPIGRSAILKASKSYYLKSISEQGETWARDIPNLHDYLESHFSEMSLAMTHVRDVPAGLAELEVRRRMAVEAPSQPAPTIDELSQLQQELARKQRDITATRDLLSLGTMNSQLLTGYARRQTESADREVQQLEQSLQQKQQRLSLLRHLQREYQQKGSAAAYTFTVSSNLQAVSNPQEFRDALRQVVKEVTDLHRHQISQKLSSGKLNIQIAEATEPTIVWIEQWLGGALSPTQLQRLGPEFAALRDAANQHLMVVPDEDIQHQEHTRQAAKHLGARVLSTVLQRLDQTDKQNQQDRVADDTPSKDSMPLDLGLRIDESGKVLGPARFPLIHLGHCLVTGTTGAGKSFVARALIEEAARYSQLNILVLDPRNQSAGLRVPEDRENVIKQYPEFQMRSDAARGFPFNYYAPAMPFVQTLPADLAALATGQSIVAFKGMDERQRCTLAADILRRCFDACSDNESETPRLLILIDESHLFTRKHVDKSAHDAAAQVERAIEKIAREGRKFGVLIVLITQTVKSWGFDLSTIRQMISTRVFLRNSGADSDYADDIVGDGKLLVQLQTGQAILHNAMCGAVRMRVRPPCSKVIELSETKIREMFHRPGAVSQPLSRDAQRLLEQIQQRASLSNQPINMSQAAELAEITSKRRIIEMIDELEAGGFIRTRKLPERGQPRVIELTP